MSELGKKKKERQLQKKQVSTALLRISERSLKVDPRHVDAYQPKEFDIQVAEAMLAGCITFQSIAEQLEMSSVTVGNHMKDPLRCAWISRAIHGNVQHRLGMVDAAMLNRAMAGDVRAADLLYKRYGEMINRSVNVNIGAGMDFAQFDDKDLDAFVKDAQKNVGSGEVGKVVEGNVAQSDPGSEGPGSEHLSGDPEE